LSIERRYIPIEELEVRADDGQAAIKGYAAVFEKLSGKMWGFREKIQAGAFASSLISKRNIKALWNHNPDYPLGATKNETLTLEEDEKGLRFELVLPDTTWGKDALESIKRGDTDGVSFGFRTKKDAWDETDPKNIVRTLVDVDLIEISPTPFPAYPQTSVGVRSHQEIYESHMAERNQEEAGAGEIDTPDDPSVQERIEAVKILLELQKELYEEVKTK
jgi:HK97 family phage prohead protease